MRNYNSAQPIDLRVRLVVGAGVGEGDWRLQGKKADADLVAWARKEGIEAKVGECAAKLTGRIEQKRGRAEEAAFGAINDLKRKGVLNPPTNTWDADHTFEQLDCAGVECVHCGQTVDPNDPQCVHCEQRYRYAISVEITEGPPRELPENPISLVDRSTPAVRRLPLGLVSLGLIVLSLGGVGAAFAISKQSDLRALVVLASGVSMLAGLTVCLLWMGRRNASAGIGPYARHQTAEE